jgi:fumarylacetoacetase
VTDGFGRNHLPYGVFVAEAGPRIGVRLGNDVLDLTAGERDGLVDAGGTFDAPTLNPFMAAGPAVWQRVRDQIQRDPDRFQRYPVADVSLRLPIEVADYVDFYSSEHHATNLGQLFRPGTPPLTPNWKHLPIGYHGRAGTVVVSGTPIARPVGQRMHPGAERPVVGPSARLDIEAEVGFVVGVGSALGAPVSAADWRDHVFGVVLVNDWSARDLQSWEYVPLGPFLGKSFATSMSAWVTPLTALDGAWVDGPVQDPPVADYLAAGDHRGLALDLEVEWNGQVVSRPPFALLYWTPDQQLAHMTVNGAALRTGDLYASGTVSGPASDQTGSFLELTWNGQRPITLPGAAVRTFLEDGDTVTLRATAPGVGGERLRLGEVVGEIRPAR